MSDNLDPWHSQKDFPEVISDSNRGSSIDVLVYSKDVEEHTVGWFDFNKMTWMFLCREAVGRFKWRYFEDVTDKY